MGTHLRGRLLTALMVVASVAWLLPLDRLSVAFGQTDGVAQDSQGATNNLDLLMQAPRQLRQLLMCSLAVRSKLHSHLL